VFVISFAPLIDLEESAMTILFLSNNPSSLRLVDVLRTQWGESVAHYEEPLSPEILRDSNPDWIVSYNYRHIVKRFVFETHRHRVINLHISLLPHNRGADPNIWSFLDDTPKGVSIHEMDEGIDTGPILLQQEVVFDDSVSLRSAYERLNDTIVHLFGANWDRIRTQQITAIPQPAGGRTHRRRELASLFPLLEQLNWNVTPAKLRELFRQTTGETHSQPTL
jgi:methionyl-tRNA formyltransferase